MSSDDVHEAGTSPQLLSAVSPGPGGALPTDPAARIVMLDVLRGVAVLGILLINVYGWAFPTIAMRQQELSFGIDTRADLWTWIAQQVAVEGTMRALFSMLFGAGVVLLTNRLAAKARGDTAAIYYRRTMLLIVFGLVHAYLLLWPGDILYYYGMVGLALFPLRKLRSRWLIAGALLCFAWLAIDAGIEDVQMRRRYHAAQQAAQIEATGTELTESQRQAVQSWDERVQSFTVDAEEIEAELEWRRSDYITIAREFADDSFRAQTVYFVRWDLWDVAGAMLLGMALMKLGVLSGRRSNSAYALLIIAGYGIGIPVNIWESAAAVDHAFGDGRMLDLSWYTYDIGRMMTALGHVGAIVLIVRAGVLGHLQQALGACGRMALTNYIMQSVICGLLFYGFGFGLVGRLGRFDCLGVVVGIWIAQLAWSPLWLAQFRYGPIEWLWRTLTYWQRVHLLRPRQ